MGSSKAFLFLGLVLALILLISSEVAAKETSAEQTNAVHVEDRDRDYPGRGGYHGGGGGYHGGGGYPGRGGGYPGGGRGGYPGGGRGGRGCYHGCCRGDYRTCYRCCSYAGEKADVVESHN